VNFPFLITAGITARPAGFGAIGLRAAVIKKKCILPAKNVYKLPGWERGTPADPE
jgi:hypothetical protein